MSKAMQGGLIILGILVIICAGIAVVFWMNGQSLQKQNQDLQSTIEEFKNKESKMLAQAKKLEKDQQELNGLIKDKEKEKDQLQATYNDLKAKYDEIKAKSDDLNNQLTIANQEKDKANEEKDKVIVEKDKLNSERDDYKGRLETIRKERDDLMDKLKKAQEKAAKAKKESDDNSGGNSYASNALPADAPSITSPEGDLYWGKVLKEKEALKLDLEKAKEELDQSALEVVELKKKNADIALDLKNLTDEKAETEKKLQDNQAEYERKLKYNEDLANSLSVEVARARSEQRSSTERVDKFKQDNQNLQEQLKQLSTTKLALEKTIASINKDKVMVQKKLNETEGAIQGRIDEIWQIKQNLDQKISQLPPTNNSEVELPPIIVNANGSGAGQQEPMQIQNQSQGQTQVMEAGKSQGTIISINEPNNFAIVDLGEGDGSQVGRKLNVFRNNKPIGALQVIQVRKDISAADIKQSTVKVKVGDTVRY